MATDTPTKKKEPTAQEAMFFFAIVKHTRNKADIDWNAVAAEQGFKNAEVAKVRFGQVKRKLGISSDAPPTAGSTSRTPVKKKGSSTTGGTPTKVVKTPGRAGAKGGKVQMQELVKKEVAGQGGHGGHVDDDDDDDDEKTVVGAKSEGEEDEDEDEDDEEDEQDKSLHAEVDAFLKEEGEPGF